MTQPTQGPEGMGNTTTIPDIRGRKWCFTINNYDEEDIDTLSHTFSEKGWKYIIGREVGENGTPHLQGFLETKSAIRFKTIKKLMPRAHIEKTKGTINDNIKYCSKDGDFVSNIEYEYTAEELYNNEMKEQYNNVVWKDWQQNVINLINEKPDKRSVIWIWEKEGNVGKSFLVQYLDWKYDAIIANGKQSDVFNQYKEYIEVKKKQPKIALIDVPRSHENYICYSTFEKIKDGLFYSGKYEGGKLRVVKHHLIIFANFAPKTELLSSDRWKIIDLNEIKSEGKIPPSQNN